MSSTLPSYSLTSSPSVGTSVRRSEGQSANGEWTAERPTDGWLRATGACPSRRSDQRTERGTGELATKMASGICLLRCHARVWLLSPIDVGLLRQMLIYLTQKKATSIFADLCNLSNVSTWLRGLCIKSRIMLCQCSKYSVLNPDFHGTLAGISEWASRISK